MTQEQLASAADCSVDTISNIERGFSSTRLDTAQDLAKVLGVSLPELFELGGRSDKGKEHRREVDRLMRLISACPPSRLSALSKLIEQALELTGEK